MKRSIIIASIFVLLILTSAFIIVDRKDTEILIINVSLAKPGDDDSSKIISQVGGYISYTKRMEVPLDTPMFTPGITVIVIQDRTEKTGWNSVSIPEKGSIYGTYSIMLMPIDTIDKSKPVSILTRVVDPSGKDISVKITETTLLLPENI